MECWRRETLSTLIKMNSKTLFDLMVKLINIRSFKICRKSSSLNRTIYKQMLSRDSYLTMRS